ncbi:DUF1120 domain-containing protein [Pseudomonas sp. RA_105y_Pfl1_P41]|uniref:DUF1120 domain-containing protein n=1 Tax=Pseudomonas sp. RA_105y_Pfl1_P41 TaxID=3088700 RepID=UPI0030D91FC6
MSKSFHPLVAALLLSAATQAVAASSVDLSVRGLITPSACVPEISNAGVYDIGKISAKDLNVETYTRLDPHNMQLKVTCEAATLLALQPKDNRPGTAFRDEGGFGLGLINGDEKLGAFWVTLASAVADGASAEIIESLDGGSTWIRGGYLATDSIASVAENATLVPTPVQTLSMEMTVKVIIAPTNTLTLTQEVPIDGSATVTVMYL